MNTTHENPTPAGGTAAVDSRRPEPSLVVEIDDSSQPAVFVASFAEFYSLQYPSIAKALAVALSDTALGREAADEAMTRAYARWGTVSGYANPSGWVYKVGLNWARSWYRRRSKSLPWVDRQEAALPETTDPDLRDAIGRLGEKYRDVVVCRFFFDWSTDQTAEALGIRPGTVKSRLSTAMNALRADLGDAR